jgi:hypothetical protein
MKNFIYLFLFLSSFVYSQGMIVNELSNGSAGNQEYYELVVVGSSLNPTGLVDLGGWIIDDNNGDFEGTVTTGIATGHIRIKPGFLSSVKPGSIIVIYNKAELMLTDDPTDSDGDCVYIIPINNVALDNNNTNPSTTNPNYIPSLYGALQSWIRIGLRNDGDVGQVRKPNGTFYHGFSYGDVISPFPNFPLELGGGSSFNVITGSGTGKNYFFNCGSFTTPSNFSRGVVPTNETPGQPNNNQNRYFINSLRTGTYNYSNLSDINNCGTSSSLVDCSTILPIKISYFNGEKINNEGYIQWSIEDLTELNYIDLEVSSNGYDFNKITTILPEGLFYEYFDNLLYENNYYRLKIVNFDNTFFYSNIIVIENNNQSDIVIYPNPNDGIININTSFKINKITIINYLGVTVFNEINPDNKIILPHIYNGTYFCVLEHDKGVIYQKIVIK